MAWFKRSTRLKLLATILVVAFTLGLAANLSAQVPLSVKSTSLISQLPTQWNFTPPRGRGTPVNRQGGATRGDECLQSNAALTALVPPSGVGTTASAYPTISWYMPESSASEVELVLRDADEYDIYSAKYALAKSDQGIVKGSPGIMSLSLPASANLSPLEIGKDYYWTIALICDPIDRSNDILAEGGIQRVQPSPTMLELLEQATEQERVALYAQEGLWYETVATLVNLRRNRPDDNNLARSWNQLLSSVGLDTTFKKPEL
jgi:hypothetical protein